MAATRTTLDNTFGEANIDKWADLDEDGDTTKISNRVNWALQLASDYIDGMLAETAWTDYSDEPIIVDLQARKAGVLLYETRSIVETEDEKNPVSKHATFFEQKMAELIAGKLKLPGATKASVRPFVEGQPTVTSYAS